jgi:hypothetical protein
VGEIAADGDEAWAVPVPETETDCDPRKFRLKETVMFPEKVPTDVGWNTT